MCQRLVKELKNSTPGVALVAGKVGKPDQFNQIGCLVKMWTCGMAEGYKLHSMAIDLAFRYGFWSGGLCVMHTSLTSLFNYSLIQGRNI